MPNMLGCQVYPTAFLIPRCRALDYSVEECLSMNGRMWKTGIIIRSNYINYIRKKRSFRTPLDVLLLPRCVWPLAAFYKGYPWQMQWCNLRIVLKLLDKPIPHEVTGSHGWDPDSGEVSTDVMIGTLYVKTRVTTRHQLWSAQVRTSRSFNRGNSVMTLEKHMPLGQVLSRAEDGS